LPKIDNDKFKKAFFEMVNNLEYYQQKNKEWVLQEANIIFQAKKFLDSI